MKAYKNTSDLFLIVMAVIVLAAALALFSGTIKVHALEPTGWNSDTVSITCLERDHWQYHNDDKVYCGQAVVSKHSKHTSTAPTAPTVTSEPETPVIVDNGGETIPTDTTADNTPPTVQDDKKHCNKGEGNGGEGCDPGNNPDKGNNDEDAGKDKSKKN